MKGLSMALPPYLISASLLVCDRVLVEKDEVTSAIRIVDVFYLPELPPVPPGVSLSPEIQEKYAPILTTYGLAQIKADAGYCGEHDIEFRIINTSGEESLAAAAKGKFVSHIEGATTGLTASIQINILVKRFGTCFLCLYLDGNEITRTPFTLAQQKNSGQAV
jgi:hypothetical protein